MVHKSAVDRQLHKYFETRHVDWIPGTARHGKPWHQEGYSKSFRNKLILTGVSP